MTLEENRRVAALALRCRKRCGRPYAGAFSKSRIDRILELADANKSPSEIAVLVNMRNFVVKRTLREKGLFWVVNTYKKSTL